MVPVTKTNFSRLYQGLGYEFSDSGLLVQALTHPSAGKRHYERLEFLGDSVLSLVITEFLYQAFPQLREGQLSRIRASLVNGESLSRVATDLELGRHMRLGPGEMKSGACRRESILADAMEAVIGAVYLDAGLETCRAMILRIFQSRLESPDLGRPPKDFKTRLQEYLMARGQPLPAYELVAESGPAHAREFRVECRVTGIDHVTVGEARSRRLAEQNAARDALAALGALENAEVQDGP